MRMLWSGITTGFCASRRSMRNGAVAWDGIYGIIHMAALKLQLWILISALCERKEKNSSRARELIALQHTKKYFIFFHLKRCFFLPLIRLRVSCDATFISFAKKPHVSVHRNWALSVERTKEGTNERNKRGERERVMIWLEKYVYMKLCWKIENCRGVMQFWCSHIINKGLIFIMAWKIHREGIFVCWKFYAIIFIHHKLNPH